MSFKAVQGKIEQEGYSPKAAGAILASKTRNASPAAKKANPNLKKVKGKPSTPAVKPAWSKVSDQMLGGKC